MLQYAMMIIIWGSNLDHTINAKIKYNKNYI